MSPIRPRSVSPVSSGHRSPTRRRCSRQSAAWYAAGRMRSRLAPWLARRESTCRGSSMRLREKTTLPQRRRSSPRTSLAARAHAFARSRSCARARASSPTRARSRFELPHFSAMRRTGRSSTSCRSGKWSPRRGARWPSSAPVPPGSLAPVSLLLVAMPSQSSSSVTRSAVSCDSRLRRIASSSLRFRPNSARSRRSVCGSGSVQPSAASTRSPPTTRSSWVSGWAMTFRSSFRATTWPVSGSRFRSSRL